MTKARAEFDALTEQGLRKKQGAKWQRFGRDVLPCFVADMDFPLAAPIREVLARQLEVGDFGYTRRLAERPRPDARSCRRRPDCPG